MEKNKKLEKQLAKGWTRPRLKAMTANDSNWKSVTGPTTGVVKTLTEYGWDLKSPTVWKFKEHEFQRNTTEAKKGLLEVVAVSIDEKLWAEAANHRLGSGMEFGEPMLKPVTNYIQKLRKKGDHGNATVATKVAAGGVVTPERLNSMYPEYEEECACGHFLPDETHIFWTCKLLERDSRPEVKDTQWMAKKAKEEFGLQASLSKIDTNSGKRHLSGHSG